MTDFAKARTNMVDCQIEPNGVINPAVIKAFGITPREAYMPAALKNVAYLDEDIVLPNGRIMLDPQIHARLLQLADPQADDVALVIGDGCGYASALLAQMVTTVLTVSGDLKETEKSLESASEQGICNIVALNGDVRTGAPEHAPYSLIFINGAVSEIPDTLKAQLALGGRLVCVLKTAAHETGKAVIVECLGEGEYSSFAHFDASTPFIPELAPKVTFNF